MRAVDDFADYGGNVPMSHSADNLRREKTKYCRLHRDRQNRHIQSPTEYGSQTEGSLSALLCVRGYAFYVAQQLTPDWSELVMYAFHPDTATVPLVQQIRALVLILRPSQSIAKTDGRFVAEKCA